MGADAEDILYGELQDRQPMIGSFTDHLVDPRHLGLEQGFIGHHGYSGGRGWAAHADILPAEWAGALRHEYSHDQVDLVLALASIRSGGNSARLIDPHPFPVAYAKPLIEIECDGSSHWVATDRMAALVQLSSESGNWYHLEKPHVDDGDGPLLHYLVYAPHSSDFRNEAAGIVLLSATAEEALTIGCSLCDGRGDIPDQCDGSGWVRRGGTTRRCYGCNRCSHVMKENERSCPKCSGSGRMLPAP